MYNKIIISLILLSIVLAGQSYQYDGCEQNNSCNCHPSCICDAGSPICKKCRLSGSTVDENKRSCPCPLGQFTSSMNPFQCTKLLIPNSKGGSIEDACQKECLAKLKNISIDTNCYFCNVDGKSYVISEVSLNFNSVSLSNECKKYFSHKVQYLNPKTNLYVDLPLTYISGDSNGSLEIKIPLIDVFNLTSFTNVGDHQIAQQINLLSILSVKGKVGKQIKWAICVYTNRDEVQIFQLDIDYQQTTEDCDDCIVIADLDTVGKIYTDSTFKTLKAAPYTYTIGDYFYAKITFVDTSYTKFLKFVSLFYKNDLGQIFDYSSITTHAWSGNGLTIALLLNEPSHPATIQVVMLIDPISGGRFLQNTDEQQQKQKTNFSFSVASNKNGSDNANQQNQQTISSIILFGLINLTIFIFII